MNAWRWIAFLALVVPTVGRSAVIDELGRLVGFQVVDSSYVRQVERAQGSGRIVELANGQVWLLPELLLSPLRTDTAVVLEKSGSYVVALSDGVSVGRLLRGSAPVSTAVPITADVYDELADRYDRAGNKELAAAARARAKAMREKSH